MPTSSEEEEGLHLPNHVSLAAGSHSELRTLFLKVVRYGWLDGGHFLEHVYLAEK